MATGTPPRCPALAARARRRRGYAVAGRGRAASHSGLRCRISCCSCPLRSTAESLAICSPMPRVPANGAWACGQMVRTRPTCRVPPRATTGSRTPMSRTVACFSRAWTVMASAAP